MSFGNLPYELVSLILKDLQDSFEFEHFEYIRTVKTLRLTSRSLYAVATKALYKSLHLTATDPKSWLRMKQIQQQTTLIEHVKVLVVTRWYILESNFRDELNLASMPNLERIIVEMTFVPSEIHFKRQGPVKSCENADQHILFSVDQSFDKENNWGKFISDLASGASVLGYKPYLLDVNLRSDFEQRFWKSILPTINLRYLHTLKLREQPQYPQDQQVMTSIVLPAIRSLPSLVHFVYRGCRSENGLKCDIFNVLEKYNWPSVRHIYFEEPQTTLTSLKNFLLPYQGKLRHLTMFGEFPNMAIKDFCKDCINQSGITKDDDGEKIRYSCRECGPVLQEWIRQKIAPDYFTVGNRFSEQYIQKWQ